MACLVYRKGAGHTCIQQALQQEQLAELALSSHTAGILLRSSRHHKECLTDQCITVQPGRWQKIQVHAMPAA